MPNSAGIAILFHKQAAVSFALLCQSVFRLANRISGEMVFDVRLVGADRHHKWENGQINLQPIADMSPGSYLVIPPIEDFSEETALRDRDLAMIRAAHGAGTVIASACLGAFLIAEAGLLKDREATTHWSRIDYAARRFPTVRWNGREMLIDHGDVVTAGGLLSAVDLCLHIVRKTCGREFSLRLGRHLLADTIRQKQSLYAVHLTAPPKDAGRFAALEAEIERQHPDSPSVAEMADFCGMSLRSFHRHFEANYGVTPVKYLQLRKIEKAKSLLAESHLPLETIAGETGFSDMAFFRTVFARETGLTPGQFRRKAAAD
jgi:transcriptional regulator GlxA family with amidase domain